MSLSLAVRVQMQVPRIVMKDIPYIVPRYVEKIIEVPYQPGQKLPAPKVMPNNSDITPITTHDTTNIITVV